MRIAIIGQQAFGASVLDAFHARGDDIAGVFCAPEKPGAKPDPLRQRAEALGLPVFQFASLKGADAASALRGLDVELGVMAYVLQFAPQDFVNIPRHGSIVYHPSLLPAYRGPSSINWPIIRGDTRTGLTIFRPTDGLDEGPVILQKTVEIGPDATLGDIYFNHLFPEGVKAMLEAADLVVAGKHEETAQDESLASYEGWCKDVEARVNWGAHLDQIHNLVRGCNPAPGAWTMVRGRRLRLFDAARMPARRFADVAGKPGQIASVGEVALEVVAQGGILAVKTVRPDGGAKMAAADFAREAGLQAGDYLSDDFAEAQARIVERRQGAVAAE